VAFFSYAVLNSNEGNRDTLDQMKIVPPQIKIKPIGSKLKRPWFNFLSILSSLSIIGTLFIGRTDGFDSLGRFPNYFILLLDASFLIIAAVLYFFEKPRKTPVYETFPPNPPVIW
jgi:hypothetical protein